jgi:hypothetical protein
LAPQRGPGSITERIPQPLAQFPKPRVQLIPHIRHPRRLIGVEKDQEIVRLKCLSPHRICLKAVAQRNLIIDTSMAITLAYSSLR